MKGPMQPPPSLVDVETNHFYVGELTDDAKAAAAFSAAHDIGRRLIGAGPGCFSTMIDDYNEQTVMTRSEMIERIEQWSPRPTYLVFESDFAPHAEALIAALRPSVLGTDGSDLYLYTTSNSLLLWGRQDAPTVDYLTMFAQKYALPEVRGAESAEPRPSGEPPVPVEHADAATRTLLRSGSGSEARYSCSLLIACWNLARLGVEPFCSVERHFLGERTDAVPERVWSILPSTFLKVEANAREIIDLCRSKHLNKKVRRISHVFM